MHLAEQKEEVIDESLELSEAQQKRKREEKPWESSKKLKSDQGDSKALASIPIELPEREFLDLVLAEKWQAIETFIQENRVTSAMLTYEMPKDSKNAVRILAERRQFSLISALHNKGLITKEILTKKEKHDYPSFFERKDALWKIIEHSDAHDLLVKFIQAGVITRETLCDYSETIQNCLYNSTHQIQMKFRDERIPSTKWEEADEWLSKAAFNYPQLDFWLDNFLLNKVLCDKLHIDYYLFSYGALNCWVEREDDKYCTRTRIKKAVQQGLITTDSLLKEYAHAKYRDELPPDDDARGELEKTPLWNLIYGHQWEILEFLIDADLITSNLLLEEDPHSDEYYDFEGFSFLSALSRSKKWDLVERLVSQITTQALLQKPSNNSPNVLSHIFEIKNEIAKINLIKSLVNSSLQPLKYVPWEVFKNQPNDLLLELIKHGEIETFERLSRQIIAIPPLEQALVFAWKKEDEERLRAYYKTCSYSLVLMLDEKRIEKNKFYIQQDKQNKSLLNYAFVTWDGREVSGTITEDALKPATFPVPFIMKRIYPLFGKFLNITREHAYSFLKLAYGAPKQGIPSVWDFKHDSQKKHWEWRRSLPEEAEKLGIVEGALAHVAAKNKVGEKSLFDKNIMSAIATFLVPQMPLMDQDLLKKRRKKGLVSYVNKLEQKTNKCWLVDSSYSLFSKNARKPKGIKTKGEGDCAFHAVLGQMNEKSGQYECRDVPAQRNKMAQAIKDSKEDSPIYKLALAGIEAIVMGNHSIAGEGIKSLKKQYTKFKDNQEETKTLARQLLEDAISESDVAQACIIPYLPVTTASSFETWSQEEQNRALCTRLLELRDEKFLEQWKEISEKNPNLARAFRRWHMIDAKKFDLKRHADSAALINEYADDIRKKGRWLLPLELEMLAITFERHVCYYPSPAAEPIHYNPGERELVYVSFAGKNHYEQGEPGEIPTLSV